MPRVRSLCGVLWSIRAYEVADYKDNVALFTRINRELAPAHMRELLEQYISTAISGELRQLQDIFSEAKRNAFWVVDIDAQIVGMFGIESRSDEATELRRMYLDRPYRGRGIAQRMLQCAEARARELGFTKLILRRGHPNLARHGRRYSHLTKARRERFGAAIWARSRLAFLAQLSFPTCNSMGPAARGWPFVSWCTEAAISTSQRTSRVSPCASSPIGTEAIATDGHTRFRQ